MIPALREFFYFVDKVQFFAARQHLPFGCATVRLDLLYHHLDQIYSLIVWLSKVRFSKLFSREKSLAR